MAAPPTDWMARASKAETANDTLIEDYTRLESQLAERDAELEAQKQKAKDAEAATQAAKTNDDLQNDRISQLETKLHDSEEEAKRLQNQIESKDAEVAKHEAAEEAADARYKKEKKEYAIFVSDNNGLRISFDESEQNVSELNTQVADLTAELDRLKNVEADLIRERQNVQGMQVIAKKLKNDVERSSNFNQTPGHYVAPSTMDEAAKTAAEKLQEEIDKGMAEDSESEHSTPEDTSKTKPPPTQPKPRPTKPPGEEVKTKPPGEASKPPADDTKAPPSTIIRYIPYDTIAHSPFACWFTTERNMLILFVRWLTELFNLFRRMCGFPPAPPSSPPSPPAGSPGSSGQPTMLNQALLSRDSVYPGYAVPMMMSQVVGNGAGGPGTGTGTGGIGNGNGNPIGTGRTDPGIGGDDLGDLGEYIPPADNRQVIPPGNPVPPGNRVPGGTNQAPANRNAIFTPDPNRLPPAWDTFIAFLCHVIVYLTLIAGYLAYQERHTWLDANGDTRRLLHQLSSYHRSGVSFIVSILPPTFARWYDVMLYNLLDSCSIPIANAPMPG